MANNSKKTVQVSIDKKLCINCGTCYAIMPKHFTLSSDGKSEVIGQFTTEEASTAKSLCPVGAIKTKSRP